MNLVSLKLVRVLAAALFVVTAFLPQMSPDRLSSQVLTYQEKAPAEVSDDVGEEAFSKGLPWHFLDVSFLLPAASTTDLFLRGTASAHFLETSRLVLQKLRI